jgi:quinol-cytochrome oxidoreductase complex cytochrome b subunit
MRPATTRSGATARDLPRSDPPRSDVTGTPFFPDFVLKEAIAALVLLSGLVLLAVLTKPTLDAIADPNVTGYAPRPEWYFLWLFQLLKYFKGSLDVVGTVLVPAGLVVLLLAVPFIDRRDPKTRVLVRGTRPVRVAPRLIAAVFIAAVLALTVLAATASLTPSGFLGPRQPAPEWPPATRQPAAPVQ